MDRTRGDDGRGIDRTRLNRQQPTLVETGGGVRVFGKRQPRLEAAAEAAAAEAQRTSVTSRADVASIRSTAMRSHDARCDRAAGTDLPERTSERLPRLRRVGTPSHKSVRAPAARASADPGTGADGGDGLP